MDGGTVKVVNADGSKSDVTYDGNNQYAKEVTEGEDSFWNLDEDKIRDVVELNYMGTLLPIQVFT